MKALLNPTLIPFNLYCSAEAGARRMGELILLNVFMVEIKSLKIMNNGCTPRNTFLGVSPDE